MELSSVTKNDFKKWLLYSYDSNNHQNLFNLYKALDQVGTSGDVECIRSSADDGEYLSISSSKVNEKLIIKGSAREEFKKYLVENYFGTENIEEWYVQKIQGASNEKFSTHEFSEVNVNEGGIPVKPHPKELFYLKIRIAISAIFYLSIVGFLAAYVIANPVYLFSILLLLPAILFLYGISVFFQGIFVGYIKGNSIQLTPEQFPEIYAIVKEESQKLKLTELPQIYITEGHFNAFVTSFARSKVLLIFSEVIETSLAGEYDVVRFVIAHELCHIKRKHLLLDKILIPSNIIPFLFRAYSRGREYTCDRTGYLASPRGAVKGILIMTTGKEIYSKFDIDQHIKNSAAGANFWTWISEKFMTHPHLFKRLIAVKKFSEFS